MTRHNKRENKVRDMAGKGGCIVGGNSATTTKTKTLALGGGKTMPMTHPNKIQARFLLPIIVEAQKLLGIIGATKTRYPATVMLREIVYT